MPGSKISRSSQTWQPRNRMSTTERTVSREKNRFSRWLEFIKVRTKEGTKKRKRRRIEREKLTIDDDKSIITRFNIIERTAELGWINRSISRPMVATKCLDFWSFPPLVAGWVSCDRHGQSSSWLTSDKREFHAEIIDTACVGTPLTGFRVQEERNPSFLCFFMRLTWIPRGSNLEMRK